LGARLGGFRDESFGASQTVGRGGRVGVHLDGCYFYCVRHFYPPPEFIGCINDSLIRFH
jgi:hypothetical protein